MPFRTSWGPAAGVVTVIVDTAQAALELAADYESQGREDIVVTTLDAEQPSLVELKTLTAMGSDDQAQATRQAQAAP